MVAASSELIRKIDAIERARDHGVISDVQHDADAERLLRRCGALRQPPLPANDSARRSTAA